MKKQLKVELLGYWHSGGGRTSGSHVDRTMEYDRYGLPKLPGRHLKGLLRNALMRAEDWGWFSEHGNAPQAGWENWLCGTPAQKRSAEENRHSDLARFNSEPGCLYISDACLPDDERNWLAAADHKGLRSQLYRSLFSTAIDSTTGTAKPHSLRGIEVGVPVTLLAELELTVDDQEQAAKAWEIIEQALSLITAVGASRNRGLGRARLTLEEAS